jgi:activating signal cointegrator 1
MESSADSVGWFSCVQYKTQEGAPMKALTLWQPWASLVAMEVKLVETRCWSTKYRGELAIHAAAQLPPGWLGRSRYGEKFRQELADVFMNRESAVDSLVQSLPRGCVLCIVRLVHIEPTEQAAGYLCQRELIFGNYEEGRYAWFFEMIEKFDVPIPAKGNRMLWNWK